MSVRWIHVTSTLTALTPAGVLLALVDLDTLGVDSSVMVCPDGVPVLNNIYDVSAMLTYLAIPPPINLVGTGMVSVGRAFHLTCQSIDDFSGDVVWMKAGENVPSIGMYLYHCSFIRIMTLFSSS